MLIDHIAWAFVPTASILAQAMHFVGRFTAPVMAYFVAEGYVHTHDFKKYASRMAAFAVVSWLPYVWFEYGRVTTTMGGIKIPMLIPQSVIFTLLLSLLAIRLCDEKSCQKSVKILGVISICALSLIGDWYCFGVLYCLNFFINRENKKSMWINYCIISAAVVGISNYVGFQSNDWYIQLFQLGVFVPPLVIAKFYNGESGKKSVFNKWFFYIFYPLHLVVICVIKYVILK